MPVQDDEPLRHLTLQFLQWVEDSPRTYGEVIDAWRTSCPRLPVWETALEEGYVSRGHGGRLRDTPVLLTDKGKQALKAV